MKQVIKFENKAGRVAVDLDTQTTTVNYYSCADRVSKAEMFDFMDKSALLHDFKAEKIGAFCDMYRAKFGVDYKRK